MKSLRELRKSNGFTLEVLKDKTELTQAGLSRIENGLQVPDPATRKVLEDFFNEPINWLKTEHIHISPRYPTDWLDVEGEFRRFFRLVAGLPEDTRNEFIKTCYPHLERLEKSKIYISEPE